MSNQKDRPQAEKEVLKSGVAMLDFENSGHSRKKNDSEREKWSRRYGNQLSYLDYIFLWEKK